MTTKGRRRAATALLLVLASAPILLDTGAGTAWAQGETTTTTEATTTSTSAPPTTEPTTATPRPLPPSTTTEDTSDHIHHPRVDDDDHHYGGHRSSSSTPWGWIILAIVLLLAAVLVAVLIGRSRRTGSGKRLAALGAPGLGGGRTGPGSGPVADRATTTPSAGPASASRWRRPSTAWSGSASSAPDDLGRNIAARSAESLRGLAFAVEADHLMRSGGEHPTGEQLAAADATRRGRAAELEANLLELKAAVTPPPTGADPTSSAAEGPHHQLAHLAHRGRRFPSAC